MSAKNEQIAKLAKELAKREKAAADAKAAAVNELKAVETRHKKAAEDVPATVKLLEDNGFLVPGLKETEKLASALAGDDGYAVALGLLREYSTFRHATDKSASETEIGKPVGGQRKKASRMYDKDDGNKKAAWDAFAQSIA